MNNTAKYGLIFLGGIALGALGAVALMRAKPGAKDLATDLISGGMDLRDKLMKGIEGVKEDIADVVAEAQHKSQERKQAQEQAEVVVPAEPVAAAPEAKPSV